MGCGGKCCPRAEKLQTREEWAQVGGKVMSIKGFNEYSGAEKILSLLNKDFTAINQKRMEKKYFVIVRIVTSLFCHYQYDITQKLVHLNQLSAT